MTIESLGLVKYDGMVKAIAECVRVDEVKSIRDKALALEKYFAQASNVESERLAINVRLRAESRCGELLKEMKINGERATGYGDEKKLESRHTIPKPTLSDLGISPDQASRFMQLAAIPKEDFERALQEPVKQSTSGILRKYGEKKEPEQKINEKALYLWGRLRDFERELLGGSARSLVKDMTPAMQADVKRLAPAVIEYLEGI